MSVATRFRSAEQTDAYRHRNGYGQAFTWRTVMTSIDRLRHSLASMLAPYHFRLLGNQDATHHLPTVTKPSVLLPSAGAHMGL